jgi:hypothetical protein
MWFHIERGNTLRVSGNNVFSRTVFANHNTGLKRQEAGLPEVLESIICVRFDFCYAKARSTRAGLFSGRGKPCVYSFTMPVQVVCEDEEQKVISFRVFLERDA